MNRSRPNDPCWCGSGLKYKRCHGPKEALPCLAPSTQGWLSPGHVAPAGIVPPNIPRPEYARPRGRPGRHERFSLMHEGDEILNRMRQACRLARKVLDQTLAAVRPGVTTEELDQLAHGLIIAAGAYPSPLHYLGFPKSICTSVNEVICHGIPDDRALRDGDLINVDITVYLDGMHGDCSATVAVGNLDESGRHLIEVARACLELGVQAVRPGGMLRDVGQAIEAHANSHGCSVVRDFVGHGVGEHFHMAPQVPHYYDGSLKTELRPGMVFTIEPMINAGTWRKVVWADGWTAVTSDGQRSAQFEHTVRVAPDGVEVLTTV